MLVKELRQGLKSPVFVWGLIVMQLALAVMAVVSMEEGIIEETTQAFWWSLAGIVCILLPMRVANALRDEMGGNTMDMLVLTQLSAWRITLGKWLATAALQVLVAMTVLPYLMMRYFAGGVNLPVELACMGVFVVFGLLVTAIMLGLSWFRYFLVRAAVMLAVLVGAVSGCAGLLEGIEDINRYGLDSDIEILGWPGVVWIGILVAWFGFFFLDLGVAQIAPISENRATRRRLAAVILFVAGGACAFWSKELKVGAVLIAMLFPAIVIVCVQAICERPSNLAPVLQPFVKRGVAGRVAGRILYPGWHSGLVFTLLMLGVAAGLTIYIYHLFQAERVARFGDAPGRELPLVLSVFSGIVGAVILPLVVWRVCRAMPRWNFWRWLMVLICAGLVHGAIMIVMDRTSARAARANLAFPTSGFLVPEMASLEVRELWDEKQAEESKREAAKRAAKPKDPAVKSKAKRPASRASYYDWEERERMEEGLSAELSTYALISLAVWLGIAALFALKEMRETRRAEDEVAAALAAHRLAQKGTAV
jgi:hypothetical protein